MIALWDDHDVLDNWYWERRLDEDPRYHEKSAGVLAQKAERAFREFMPLADGLDGTMRLFRKFSFGPRLDLFRLDMRSFRAPNGPNRQASAGLNTAFLGIEQIIWLKQALKGSTATWKIIAADMPLGSSSTTTGAASRASRPLPMPTMAPAGTRVGDRRSPVVHPARKHPQRALDHGRRALSGDTPLRSRPRRLPRLHAVL